MLGLRTSRQAHMTIRERIDFSIIMLLFGTLVAGLALSILHIKSMFHPCFVELIRLRYYRPKLW